MPSEPGPAAARLCFGAGLVPPGPVYWFTGLSGAGKSTLASLSVVRLRERGAAVVYLDGDVLRAVFGHDLGYSEADRRICAGRNGRLCNALAEQGLTVVCATISLFHACHEWNRANISGYVEIFVRAPMEVLRARDRGHLYARRGGGGELRNVVGIDIHEEQPRSPNLVVDNDGSKTPAQLVEEIFAALNLGVAPR
ncbi:MAG: adenylyl-sulfate kinase [Nannocystaceae bacterium]